MLRTETMIAALLACAGCAAEVAYGAPAQSADPPAAAEPVVGRLKTRHRTIDLTASTFATGRNDVPREAIASQVMADIHPDTRSPSTRTADSFNPARGR